jgi:shikimate dehydrogenase
VEVATAGGAAFVSDFASAHRQRLAGSGEAGYLIGLVGRGIGGSRSPRMHEREGKRLKTVCSYALLDFDRFGASDTELGVVLDAAEVNGFSGVNVTHPFKQSVVEHLTDLAPEAAAIGAVNTVVFRDGRRIGHNTDAWGFAESLRRHLSGAALDKVMLYGAGGAGAAVGYALLECGTTILDIYDPDDARATRLADRLTQRFGRMVVPVTDPVAALRRASGAVNATPIGMDKYPGVAFDPAALAAGQWVADVVYFPAETELLRRAKERGCRTLPGTGMAIFQAVKAFEHFTQITPDPDAMARHFEAAA